MRPQGPEDEAKMGPLEASGRLGAPWVLSWGAPGWTWAPLGALRAVLGAVLGALGPLLGPLRARFGFMWASRKPFLELGGPLWKAPLRNRENHEIR